MLVGRLLVHCVPGMGFAGLKSAIAFDDMDKMEAAYKRVAEAIGNSERGNRSRDTIEIEGADCRETFVTGDIKGVAINDYAKSEKLMAETKGKYPNILPDAEPAVHGD